METSPANSDPRDPEVSVLVPAYNAAPFLAANLQCLADFLRGQPYDSEIILVDDGSTDRTGAIGEEFACACASPSVRVLHGDRNEGKGAAITRGLGAARGRFAVILDADLEYAPEQIAPLVAALQRGADLAVANRQLPQSRLRLHRSELPHHFLRYVVGRILNLGVRALLLPGMHDTQAGLKGLRVESTRPLAGRLRCRRFGVDVEMLLLAREQGLAVVEVPVVVESHGEHSTIRLASDSAVLLRDLGVILFRSVLGTLGEATGWRGGLPVPVSRGVARRTIGLLAGLLLLVAGGLMTHYHLADLGGRAFVSWLVALAAILLLASGLDGGWYRSRRPRFASRGELLVFCGLLAVVALLRLYHLDTVPPMMHGDSAECGMLGRDILAGRVADVFDFSPWYNTPFISFTPYAASFGAFRLSVFSLRLPSALMGILAAVPLYFLGRAWFGTRVAQLTTFLYAVSHPLVHFSRIGLWNIEVMFVQVFVFAFLIGALSRGSAVLGAVAGILTGVGLYSYTAARIIPVIAAVTLAFALLTRLRRWREVMRVALPFALGAAMALLPLVLDYVKHPDVLEADRTRAVSVLGDENRQAVEQKYDVHSAWGLLREQTRRTLAGFSSLGDASTQYGSDQPILSPFSLPFFLLGIGLALWHLREQRYFVPLAWLLLILVFGSILVLDPPSYTRLVAAFPVVCLFVAIGIDAAVRVLERRDLLRAHDAAALCGLVLLQSAAFNLVGYYNFLGRMDVMPREWDVLKVMTNSGPKVDYYLFTGPFLYADHAVFRLFSDGARTVSGFSDTDIPDRLVRDTVFVLTPEFRRLGVVIQERLPGAEMQVYRTQGQSQVFVYRCTTSNGCRRGTA